jgi:hypothetical protein
MLARLELCLRLICGEELDLAARCALLDLIDATEQQPPQNRLDARDAAIRAAGRLYAGPKSTIARKLSRDWSKYLALGWRLESALPDTASELRRALHSIARLTGRDDSLGARQILRILEG